eukprot:m.17067 g.17067  ORF g.17067 m.17067 type:complete len:265 (+) comp11322_c0_seq1:526-1320(+)
MSVDTQKGSLPSKTKWWLFDDDVTTERKHADNTWKDIWMYAAEHGVTLARFSVLAAWIFVFQTGGSLYFVAASVGSIGVTLNLVFSGVYTVLYAVFLVAYQQMQTPPPFWYHLGVWLYTLGYAMFLALFCLVAVDTSTSRAITGCYITGSVLFLIGSVFLVVATIPKQLCGVGPSACWGSCLFLLGSVSFTTDAIWANPTHNYTFGVAGNSFFLLGRIFFLHGSTTPECDCIFRNCVNTTSTIQRTIHGRHQHADAEDCDISSD